jgi:hypothetical protein
MRRFTPITNHHQHAHKIANHVMQESIAHEIDADQRAVTPKSNALKTPDR